MSVNEWCQCRTHKGGPRDAFEGTGFESRVQRRLHRRFEEVGKAVLGGYCRVQMPLKLPVAVGKRAGEPLARGRGPPPLSNASLGGASGFTHTSPA